MTSQQKSKEAMQELKDVMKSWEVEESRAAETTYHKLEAWIKKYELDSSRHDAWI